MGKHYIDNMKDLRDGMHNAYDAYCHDTVILVNANQVQQWYLLQLSTAVKAMVNA